MRRILFYLLSPVIFVVGRLFSFIYYLLFGWWLDPRDNRKADARFVNEIRAEMPFLFTDFNASMVPTVDAPPRAFDAAFVTLLAGNLIFRFLRARGDLTVEVAPQHLSSEWHDLALVAMVVDTPRGIGPRKTMFDLRDVSQVLRMKFRALNEALSPQNYPTIKQRLDNIYDLSADDLWNAGITLPTRLRTYPKPIKR